MKKIKYLLLGIVSILGIGFSSAYTGINSMFSYIDGDNGQTMAYFVGYDNGTNIFGRLGISPFYWFYGTTLISFNTLNSFYSQSNTHLVDLFNYNQQFFSPYGFSLSSTDTGNNIVYYFNKGSSNSLIIDRNVDYDTWDSFPIIIGSNGQYLTFSGDHQIVYNGEVLNITGVNFLHYCYYGIDYNLSCVFSTDSNDLGFKFKSFVTNTNGIFEYDNFAVIPLHEKKGGQYNENFFTGSITLVLAYGKYNNNQNNGIIYSLYNCYSSDPEVLKSCSLNSKGYIDINPTSFFHRTYYNLMGNSSYVSTNGWGSFADIIYTGGHFYTRTNGYNNIFSSTSTSSSNGNRNCYNLSSCFGVFELPLQNDDSVVDILNNIEPDTNTFSGSINLPTCINTEMCTYYTGSDGVTSIYSCTTYCLESGDLQPDGSYINVLGDIYFEKSTLDLGKTLKNKNPEYLFSSGYTDSGGLISVTYFDDLFDNGAKAIGVCPFNYYPGPLDFLSEVEVQNVYPFMPLLCFYSAFQQGKQTHYFDNSELFSDTYFSNPLLSGRSEKHLLLFRFFDVLLSIGILYIFKSLIHLF